jgi:Domain of Unknown Function (DUF1080)
VRGKRLDERSPRQYRFRLPRRRFIQASAAAAGMAWLEYGPLSLAESPALEQEAITPASEGTRLFNGKDLSGLYGWLKDSHYEDPKNVFSVRDGILQISGEVDGYLATQRPYRDYRLVTEFRWGTRTYGSKTVRNSGILLHAVGPDGNRSPWMSSIECQLAQGCVGDFIVIRGKNESGELIPVTFTSDSVLARDGRTRWKVGGKPTVYSGKQFWWSKHDPDFEELIDTRGKEDVDSPLGEWTRVECICAGKRITVIVNGIPVNECYDVFPSAGKILLESEGFEIHFRKFELWPLENKHHQDTKIPR